MEEAHTEEDRCSSEKTAGSFLAAGLQLLNSDRRNSGREALLWCGYMVGCSGRRQGKWKDGGVVRCETTGKRMKHGGER